MASRSSRLRWTLFVAITFLVASVAMITTSGPGAWRNVGIGIMVAAGVVYLVVRILMIREDHFK
jgi:hypothetical protein